MNNLVKKGLIAIIAVFSLSFTSAYSQTDSPEIQTVSKMLQAFGKGDMEALKNTLSENTVWHYNGSDAIPYSGTFKGKDGAVKFISAIMGSVDILDFKVNQLLANGKTVVVLGSEKQKIKKNGKVLEQDWVQVYTVENNLITHMEEFANSAYAEKLFK